MTEVTEDQEFSTMLTLKFRINEMGGEEKQKRREAISALTKEMKKVMLRLMEEMEALGEVEGKFGDPVELNALSEFQITNIEIVDGVAKAKVSVDLDLLLSWYQSVPSAETAAAFPIIATGALLDVMSRHDFGAAAAAGSEVMVLDVAEGQLVATGKVTQNDGEMLSIETCTGYEFAYSHDTHAFRYVYLFSDPVIEDDVAPGFEVL